VWTECITPVRLGGDVTTKVPQGFPRVFLVFLSPSRKMLGSTSELGHALFFPPPFQLDIHVSPVHWTMYSMSQWKASLNKITNTLGIFEISGSHGGKYDVQNCLLGCTAV
jgi:hypothetical protein